MSWNYTDIYVAACLRPFNTHREGREHERECPFCQAIIRGEPDEEELSSAGRIEPHPQGGWMVVVQNGDVDVLLVRDDGLGLSREMAEQVRSRLADFIAPMN